MNEPRKQQYQFAAQLVTPEMEQVNTTISDALNSDIALINTLASYIIDSGGKRLRPLIHLLTAKALGYQGEHHITLAAVIEFIHTATLLHDDVIDESHSRRGQSTANDIWGNEASVLVGDFLYSRAFEMMITANNMEVMKVLANTTNAIAEGEVQQLLTAHDPEIKEATYFQTIGAKTAILFASAAKLGAIICNNTEYQQPLFTYGQSLGTAFQLIDDLLDYQGQEADMGKSPGDDLAEGKVTLPLIHAISHSNPQDSRFLKQVIAEGNRQQLMPVKQILQDTGSLKYTQAQAEKAANQAIAALKTLPESDYKQALTLLAHFSVNRSH